MNKTPGLASKAHLTNPSILAQAMMDGVTHNTSAIVTEAPSGPLENVSGEPLGLRVTSSQTGAAGIRARIVHGECFGDEIIWFEDEASEAKIVVHDNENSLPCRLDYTHLGDNVSGNTHTKGGFEHGTNTWWRYPEEANPSSYREHCLRIVEIL